MKKLNKKYTARLAKEFDQPVELIEYIVNKYPVPRDHFSVIENKNRLNASKIGAGLVIGKVNERGAYSAMSNDDLIELAKANHDTMSDIMKKDMALYTRLRKRKLSSKLKPYFAEVRLKKAIASAMKCDTWAQFTHSKDYNYLNRNDKIKEVKTAFFKVKPPTVFRQKNNLSYWKVKKVATSYATWAEFAKKEIYLLNAINKKGWTSKLKRECGHYTKPLSEYTLYDCIKCARGSATRSEFKRYSEGLYNHIKRTYGITKFWEVADIPKAKGIDMSFNEVQLIVYKYPTKTRFRLGHPRIYVYARSNGWLKKLKVSKSLT